MSDLESAALRELRPSHSIATRLAAAFARLGFRRRRQSATGQPLVRLDSRQLALFEVLFDAVFLICDQGKVRGTNAAACEMFGGSFAAFDGLSAGTFFRPADHYDGDSLQVDEVPAVFDPASFLQPTRVTALGLNYRSFPAELRSLEIDFGAARHYVLCVRELVNGSRH